MDESTKFERMIALLRSNPQARQTLLKNPERVLRSMDLDKSVLNEAHDRRALARAKALLAAANITEKDDAISGLKKLGKAAQEKYGDRFEVEIDPFGVTLLESLSAGAASRFKWTATGSIKCTWDPWDWCRVDVDW